MKDRNQGEQKHRHKYTEMILDERGARIGKDKLILGGNIKRRDAKIK